MPLPRTQTGRRLAPGDTVPLRSLADATGAAVRLPAADGLTHLQFRRFAGCPVCNLHLRSMAVRHAEIAAAGIREVVLFHSPADQLLPYADEFPFPLVPDPDRRLYAQFGVGSSPRALLDPRAWGPVLRAVAVSTWLLLRGRERPPALRQPHGRLGLPADVLLGADGRVAAVKYGEHADDQWSVDELLAVAANAVRTSQGVSDAP
ncbi:peroxiredoxin-like family protein [Streptomyces sp. NPDC060194]|uniref:peroxiredoxin-like family protein n=1 Tax=Streptomyces sp. NPDC060194 TaxID=3347069 RepID=UPI00365D2658